ncbi:unnamed protein product [Adineta steineri]|uniref:Uncharacterized protein n=1 Tax=Adineta steineri TaxID=433720 RepID=A0A814AVW8_9BILA|nr:unnamed protein product [Adineta steineri]CAF0919191.1 unnamed protein product [Adineta steineri]
MNMSTKSPRAQIEQKKREVIRQLKEGTLTTTKEPPTGSSGEFWSNLLRIKNSDNVYEPFVQCTVCTQLLSYEVKNGTNSLNLHVQGCTKKTTTYRSTSSIDKYLTKDISISQDDKRSITISCAKYCAFDIRSFNSVHGDGFQQLCQALIDTGYKFGLNKCSKPSVKNLLPDRTNVSRTIKQLAEEYRLKLKDILREDLQHVRLIGLSTDYWKNTYTTDNYLTINIHYTKNDHPVTFMLETRLFVGAKTGESTVRVIKAVLNAYGINPEETHIIYLTDNGSNFISGLQSEVHLRCVCHCLNLVVKHSLEECPKINALIKASGELVTHFKRCELNCMLTTTLKQQCDTRWNTVYDMLYSIEKNFKEIESILVERKEYGDYIDQIDYALLKGIGDILLTFKKASEQLSSDQEPTLHLVLPWTTKLKNVCETKSADNAVIKQLKKNILTHIEQSMWLTQLHDIATFLHPVSKNLLSYSQKEREEVHKATRTMLKTIKAAEPNKQHKDVYVVDNVSTPGKTPKRMKKSESCQEDVLHDFAQNNESESDAEEDIDEVERYIKAKVVYMHNESLLAWWKKWSINYPQLSLLARSLLGVPASSATSERVFSTSGRILEERRQNLNEDAVNDILLLRNFRKCIE